MTPSRYDKIYLSFAASILVVLVVVFLIAAMVKIDGATPIGIYSIIVFAVFSGSLLVEIIRYPLGKSNRVRIGAKAIFLIDIIISWFASVVIG
jgi:hypothetical protein